MEVSLNFVIIAVLALVALIVIALFFTGAMSKIITKQSGVVKITDQELSLLEAGCQTYCSLCQQALFDNPPFEASIKNVYAKCSDLPKIGSDYWGKNCAKNCAADNPTLKPTAAP